MGGVLDGVLSRASAQEMLPSQEAPTAVDLGLGTTSSPRRVCREQVDEGCEPALLWAEAVMSLAPAALQWGAGRGLHSTFPREVGGGHGHVEMPLLPGTPGLGGRSQHAQRRPQLPLW